MVRDSRGRDARDGCAGILPEGDGGCGSGKRGHVCQGFGEDEGGLLVLDCSQLTLPPDASSVLSGDCIPITLSRSCILRQVKLLADSSKLQFLRVSFVQLDRNFLHSEG